MMGAKVMHKVELNIKPILEHAAPSYGDHGDTVDQRAERISKIKSKIKKKRTYKRHMQISTVAIVILLTGLVLGVTKTMPDSGFGLLLTPTLFLSLVFYHNVYVKPIGKLNAKLKRLDAGPNSAYNKTMGALKTVYFDTQNENAPYFGYQLILNGESTDNTLVLDTHRHLKHESIMPPEYQEAADVVRKHHLVSDQAIVDKVYDAYNVYMHRSEGRVSAVTAQVLAKIPHESDTPSVKTMLDYVETK